MDRTSMRLSRLAWPIAVLLFAVISGAVVSAERSDTLYAVWMDSIKVCPNDSNRLLPVYLSNKVPQVGFNLRLAADRPGHHRSDLPGQLHVQGRSPAGVPVICRPQRVS